MNIFDFLTVAQVIYIAAFIDCHGSIYAQIKRGEYALGFRIAISIAFHQKLRRKPFLLKIQRELGKRGILRDRGDGMAELTLQGDDLIYALLLRLKPYVRIKSKQLNLTLRLLEMLPHIRRDPKRFLEAAKLADQIASYNDSKNRTMTAEVVERTLFPVETKK